MSDKGKQILETFGKAIPGLSDVEKEKLLAFGEGVAFMVDRRSGATDKAEGQTVRRETA